MCTRWLSKNIGSIQQFKPVSNKLRIVVDVFVGFVEARICNTVAVRRE